MLLIHFFLARRRASGHQGAVEPFAPGENVQRHRNDLPHWRQDGVTYFVTGRMADALSAPKLQSLRQEYLTWLHANGFARETRVHELPPPLRQEYYRRFRMTLEKWLDEGHGSCRLRDPAAAKIVGAAFNFFDGQKYSIGTWVVMPNHYHVLVTPHGGMTLGKVLNSWLSYTALHINRLHGKSGPFWQREPYDHIVRDEAQLRKLERYILENPAKAKLQNGEYLLGGKLGGAALCVEPGS